jgi:hypothetical protein
VIAYQIRRLVRLEIARITQARLGTRELVGRTHIASVIHHLTYNCDARARRRIYRNPLVRNYAFWVLWSIHSACGQQRAQSAVA